VLLDAIFKALDVNIVDDVETLLSYFVANDSNTLIAPYEVMNAIKKYSRAKKVGLEKAIESTTGVSSRDKDITNASKQKLLKEHWKNMETVLDEKSSRTWNVTTTPLNLGCK
jgi:hypothetical protein